MKVSITALALLFIPVTQAQKQDNAAEASMGTQEKLNVDSANQQAPGTTETTEDASTGKRDGQKVESASHAASSLVPSSASWDSFHGQIS